MFTPNKRAKRPKSKSPSTKPNLSATKTVFVYYSLGHSQLNLKK